MRLLLGEMFPPSIAEQLRARGHDVVSVHDPDYRKLIGASDVDIVAAAIADDRAVVTENVSDFRGLEAERVARGQTRPKLVFTTNRQFPRGAPGTVGRLVVALDFLLDGRSDLPTALFLKPA